MGLDALIFVFGMLGKSSICTWKTSLKQVLQASSPLFDSLSSPLTALPTPFSKHVLAAFSMQDSELSTQSGKREEEGFWGDDIEGRAFGGGHLSTIRNDRQILFEYMGVYNFSETFWGDSKWIFFFKE